MNNLNNIQEKMIVLTTRDRDSLELDSALPTGFNIPTNMLVNGGISVILILALAYFTRVLLQSVGQLIKVVKK